MRRTRRGVFSLVILTVCLAMVATACGSSKKSSNGTTATTAAQAVPKGGTLVLAADQEMDCADFIGSCGASLWGEYVMGRHVMPVAFDMGSDGVQVPSDLLAGAPTLVTTPSQKVTYKINPKAVWSDGQAITCDDFKYTWDQEVHDSDISDRTGYSSIQTVDCPDPQTVVTTYSKSFADWKSLFSGFVGVWPSHILQGKNRDAETKDGFKWSGGPWMMDHWTKGQEIKLVPNPTYWGKKPNLDGVVFKFITDSAAEAQAYKTGQVAMIYPQAQLELAALKTEPNTYFKAEIPFNFEDLWFNTEKPPLDSKAVRQALAYATDRDQLVTSLFGPVAPGLKPIQSYTTPTNKLWYTTGFSKYTRNLTKVNSLMTGDGWAKGSDGIWAKNGQKATVELNTTAGNKRRELTEQVLQSQWKEAGFNATINNTKSGTLFGEWLPGGVFFIGIYAQTPPSPDPTQCVNFCAENAPSATNKSGENYTRIKDAALTDDLHALDSELNVAKRKTILNRTMAKLVDLVPSLPIDPLPNVNIHNSAVLGGLDPASNPIYGPFFNLNEWYCKTKSTPVCR